MGQEVSKVEQNKSVPNIPYTKFSISRASEGDKHGKSTQQGITVVHPSPEASCHANRPVEMQKLDEIHRFWPILKSSLDSIHPLEKIDNGIDYKHVLQMCQRFQEHLGESAKIIGSEQRALASRLRDLEMFSAGVTQQILRRDEKMDLVNLHLHRVDDLTKIMDNISTSLAHCIPIVQFLNNQLPVDLKLEKFVLKSQSHLEQSDEEMDTGEQFEHRATEQVLTEQEGEWNEVRKDEVREMDQREEENRREIDRRLDEEKETGGEVSDGELVTREEVREEVREEFKEEVEEKEVREEMMEIRLNERDEEDIIEVEERAEEVTMVDKKREVVTKAKDQNEEVDKAMLKEGDETEGER